MKIDFLEWTALAILLATVSILPWMLGGAIPMATLSLVVGGSLALALALVAAVLQKRPMNIPPVGFWLLIGLSAIGVLHSLPVLPLATQGMKHAVSLPAGIASDANGGAAESATVVPWYPGRTVSQSSTRTQVAQWLGLSLVFCSTFELLRTRRRLAFALWVSTLNACAVAVTGLLQLFGNGQMIVGDSWQRYASRGSFGPFVNPNNAAGWLSVHVGISLGLVLIMWGAGRFSRGTQVPSKTQWRNPAAKWQERVLQRISTLTAWHFLVVVMVGLLLTAVAATLSRAGILACVAGFLIWTISQVRWIRGPVVLITTASLIILMLCLLMVFELDTLVVNELWTLKDPVSESTGRLLHWSDSLVITKDFPVIGAGQGTYRFCTLPYQRRWTQKWFVNADNQYVEVIVESGVVGLLLFLGMGVSGVKDSLRLLRTRIAAGAGRAELSEHRFSLGATGLFVVLSQSLSMFFDFGIGLPSIASSVVMVLAALATVRWQLQVSAFSDLSGASNFLHSVSGVLVRVPVLVSAVSFLPDLWAEHRIYESVIQAERVLKAPVTRENLDLLPGIESELRRLLTSRPDDFEGLHALVRVVEGQSRLALADTFEGTAVADPQLQSAWAMLSPNGAAALTVALRWDDAKEWRGKLKAAVLAATAKHHWEKDLQTLQRAAHLMPELYAQKIAAVFAKTSEPPREKDVQDLLFAEPANARRLFHVGTYCFAAGDDRLSQICWTRSNAVSEAFRGEILKVVWNHGARETCLRDWAPQQFENTVAIALQTDEPELIAALWTLAEQQWEALPAESLSERQQIQRAMQLQKRGNKVETLAWVDLCLSALPEHLELRRMRAGLLEELGRPDDALGEWLRIQHFAPKDMVADAAIRRLSL